MTIEYNEYQRSEDCAKEIYSDLKKLPLEIREHLQLMVQESPIAVREMPINEAIKRCTKRRSPFLDVSDLVELDD